MGVEYDYGYNLFSDYLLKVMLYGVDFNDEDVQADTWSAFRLFLSNILSNRKDILYLDFKIEENQGYVKVTGLNFITALWLVGVFPEDPSDVLDADIVEIENYIFEYDKKTNKLSYAEKFEQTESTE